MNRTNPKVDGYVRKNRTWQEELQALRRIILDSPLTEEVKWRSPCYTFRNSNVVGLGAFKDCCVLSFFKGALLKDSKGILAKPGENTQAARVIRFKNARQIVELEPILKAYVEEALELERAGLRVTFKKITEHPVPEELQTRLDESPDLKTAFQSLTPGRQRAYLLYVSGARRPGTRLARVEKCAGRILAGKGLDE